MTIEGRVYKFGDDINTDEIIPARYLNTSDPDLLARYCMEDARPGFADQVEEGGIIVAGKNFGCGSSREHAPLAIKHTGIACLIAASFARIFYRNAINIGLPILEHPEAAEKISEGDRIRVDLAEGRIIAASGEEFSVPSFPGFMQEIIEKGGWIPYLRELEGL